MIDQCNLRSIGQIARKEIWLLNLGFLKDEFRFVVQITEAVGCSLEMKVTQKLRVDQCGSDRVRVRIPMADDIDLLLLVAHARRETVSTNERTIDRIHCVCEFGIDSIPVQAK